MAGKIKTLIIVLGLAFSVFMWSLPAISAADSPDCTNTNDSAGNVNESKVQTCVTSDPIVVDLQSIVNAISAVVALVIIGSLILGGIQYTTAGGAPEAVSKAKKRITNSVIALAMFLFLFAFLQWLIPGGVFS